MNINDILNEEALLLESGVRIPKGIEKAKILLHDDFDGVMSAVAMGLQLKKQGIKQIETGLLHDSDTEYEQEVKLAKRKNQLLVVVDFDRFKNKKLADKNIDVQTDHHELDGERAEKGYSRQSHKSVGTKGSRHGIDYGSDVLHISTAKAQGFITGEDLKIMNGIDSAQFGKNLPTNIYLQRKLKENDGPQNKKMRLAIITSSILGQLIRSGKTRNKGAVQSIVREVIKSPSIINFYNQVKKHVKLQNDQVKLLKAYEGKKGEGIDWAAIEEYNKKAPREMRISQTRTGEVRKTKSETGRSPAATEEDLSKRNTEKAKNELTTDKDGKKRLKAGNVGDAEFSKPWNEGQLRKRLGLDGDKGDDIPSDKFKFFAKNASAKGRTAVANAMKDSKEYSPDQALQYSRSYRYDKNGTGKFQKIFNKAWLDSFMKEKEAFLKSEKKDSGSDEKKVPTPGIKKSLENISRQNDFKGNRYMAYEDDKIIANVRDFNKFFQMSMSPGYLDRFKDAAKKHGKEFNPKEIDLVEIGKNALQKAKDQWITKEKFADFPNAEALVKKLDQAFKIVKEKSGGHKAITNVSLEPIFRETIDKYKDAAKRAKNVGNEKLEQSFGATVKKFNKIIYGFKDAVIKNMEQETQRRVNQMKGDLVNTLRGDIQKNAGVKK